MNFSAQLVESQKAAEGNEEEPYILLWREHQDIVSRR